MKSNNGGRANFWTRDEDCLLWYQQSSQALGLRITIDDLSLKVGRTKWGIYERIRKMKKIMQNKTEREVRTMIERAAEMWPEAGRLEAKRYVLKPKLQYNRCVNTM